MILDSERALERWLKFEFHNLNKNIVTQQVPIAKLLKMEIPKTSTGTGEDYQFDTASLQKLSSNIPKIFHSDFLIFNLVVD